MREPDMPDAATEKELRAIAEPLLVAAFNMKLTRAMILDGLREAYRKGWHQGWKDAPCDD